jgi:thiamine-phosphate pyrophosphorylase
VQLREKDLTGQALWALAETLRVATRATGAALYINDRVDIAVAVEADGVHLGETALPVAVARAMLAPTQRIGVSTHAAAPPHADGADFAFFGPVTATPAKAAFGPPQGWERLRVAAQAATAPVFAIGGLTPDDVPQALAAGAHGVAVIRAVLAADDPAQAVDRLLRQLAAP